MSKINIYTTIKSKEGTSKFNGKGIKNNSKIIYIDSKTKTIISLGEIITIERKKDYYLKINLKKNKKLKGEYIIDHGNLGIEAYTRDIKIRKNNIEVIYDLYINEQLIDTFIYNLEYSIDS